MKMDTEELTQEQINEFWEWCEIEPERVFEQPAWGHGAYYLKYPVLDLNSLFEHAVPKLQDTGYMVELYSYEQAGYKVAIYHMTGQVDIPIAIVKLNDPALALDRKSTR